MYDKGLIESIAARLRAYFDALDAGQPTALTMQAAWELAIDLKNISAGANTFSIHTIFHGRWQASFGVWSKLARDFYRVSRISLTPEDAIMLAARDMLAGLEESINA